MAIRLTFRPLARTFLRWTSVHFRLCAALESPLDRVDKHLVPGRAGMGGRKEMGPAARAMLLTLYIGLSMAIPMVSSYHLLASRALLRCLRPHMARLIH